MADDKKASPAGAKSWLGSWGSKRFSNIQQQQQDDKSAVPIQVVDRQSSGSSLPRTPEPGQVNQAEVLSPRSQLFRRETDAFQAELSKLVAAQSVTDVLNQLSNGSFQEVPSKPDPRLASCILDALNFLSTAVPQNDSIVSSPEWKNAIENVKQILTRLVDQSCSTFGSVFLRGIDPTSIVKLLRSEIPQLREVALKFFSHLYTTSREKPWTMSHREKRNVTIETLVRAINGESLSTLPAHIELYEAVQLYLTSSLLNSVSDVGPDPAIEIFEAERGFDAMMVVVEKNPSLSEPLLDVLRCLTYLGGAPKEFEEAFQLARAENSDEPVSEAKNPASFAAVARLVSKMLAAPTDQEPYSSIRLPLLHCVMGVYSSNPKNFGILERQFQILSQLSRRMGEPDLHDELLFMTVKLFELVALGLEYRPVTAVTVLCDVSLPALAKRGDSRTFNVLANTLLKLLQRHPSLALDCGLLKNLLLPQIAAAAKNPAKEAQDSGLTLDSLLILATCLERHPTASSATKPAVFKNNCAAARAGTAGALCKEIVVGLISGEPGKEVSFPIINSALHVIFLLAKDEPDMDLTWILELIQNPTVIQSKPSNRLRTSLFEAARNALEANRKAWAGNAGFDCVMTVLLSLEGRFTDNATEDECEDEFNLLRAALGFLNRSFKQADDRKDVSFEALFSVLKMTNVLHSPCFAPKFVRYVLQSMVLSKTASSVEDVEPLMLLGVFADGVILDEQGRLELFTKLSDLVANDGEFSAWNRQQLAHIRIAERIIEKNYDALLNPSSPLHEPLTRIVSCVGNHAATPQVVDGLLRLAYRIAQGDADGRFELPKSAQLNTSLDSLEPTPLASSLPLALGSSGPSAGDQPSPLECVVRILQLVAEPKSIGRHAVLGLYIDDDYTTPCLDIPVIFRRCWPPGTNASVANGGLNVSGYSVSCWVWLTIGNQLPVIDLVTLFGSFGPLVGLRLEAEESSEDGPDSTATFTMDQRRIVVINTPNAKARFFDTPELLPGRWHHICVVHKRTDQKNLVSSFWAGNQDAKGGSGKAELFVNGALVQSMNLNWPQAVESSAWMSARIGTTPEKTSPTMFNTRLRIGPVALFEGALAPELAAGLFMRGPTYRGSLTKISPMFQDKRAIIASAFERMHLLARDDDFINRIGGESSASGGWRSVQKFASTALGARMDPRLVSTIVRFDPDFHDDPNIREIIALPMQESLCSVGGASACFLPLLLRVGASTGLNGTTTQGEVIHFHDSSIVSLVLSLMRDSLRGSDRARFTFRLEDGHRVLAWLLHLICQSREKVDLEFFRTALSFSTTGTGLDATIVDPEALFFVAMNDHVWRRNDSKGVSYELIGELLQWMNKLVHASNRHRMLNFAALHPLNVFEWVLSEMVLLVAETQNPVKGEGKDGLELLHQASLLLDSLLRCDLDSVQIVFQYVLVTLSSSVTASDDESILQLLLRTNKVLSSLADQQNQEEKVDMTSNLPLPDAPLMKPSGSFKSIGMSLDDLRCTLLDVLIRLRRPPHRATPEEAESHSKKISALYAKHGNGEWIGCVVEYACDDLESIRRLLAFCEIEFWENPDFARSFVHSKSFHILAESLHGSRFANSPEILLFWARLVSGAKMTQTPFVDRILRRNSSSSSGTVTTAITEQVPHPPETENSLRDQLAALTSQQGFGIPMIDSSFATAAFEAILLLIRENITRHEDANINAELIQFLWETAKTSAPLSRLWTSQMCLKALVRTVFVFDMFASSIDELNADRDRKPSAVPTDESIPAENPLEFLIDLVAWAADPAEACKLAAVSFPDDASPERVAKYQSDLFLGLFPYALHNASLASILIQRASVGWTPGLEFEALTLAFECKGVPLYQLRSVVLCTIDRNFGTREEEKLLEFIQPYLPRLIAGGETDAFVGCLVRCIFSYALDQALASPPTVSQSLKDEQGEQAPAAPRKESNGGERAVESWMFFTVLCCLAPDSIKRLLVTDDPSLAEACSRAASTLTKDTKLSWLTEHGSALRHIINQNAYMTWSREMERQAGKWYVPGRIPVSSGGGDGTLLMLIEMSRSANSEKSTTAGRIRGWTTPRDRSDTFFSTEQVRLEKVGRARQVAFQRQEQLFFAKFEDLLRGKKSWGAILRKAQLPSASWEPFGGRRLDLEEMNQRWKLDPFEDFSRARRRLRQNRTFYKRYNLIKPDRSEHPIVKRESSASIASATIDGKDASTLEDSFALGQKGSPMVRGKKRAASGSSTTNSSQPLSKLPAGPEILSGIDPTIQSPLNIMRALRRPMSKQRVQSQTLVTQSTGEHSPTAPVDEDASTIGKEEEEAAREKESLDEAEQREVADSSDSDRDADQTGDDQVASSDKEAAKEEEEQQQEQQNVSLQLNVASSRLRQSESNVSDINDQELLLPSPSRRSVGRGEEDVFGEYEHVERPAGDDYTVVDIRVRAHRERVRAEMDPVDRDSVSYKANCSTVRGLEERRGLCLVGRTSLYVVDNYEVAADGTIIEVDERAANFNVQVRQQDESVLVGEETQLATNAAAIEESPVPSSKLRKAGKSPSHRKRRVRYDDILDVFRRRFLFRDLGLEIFSSDGSTLLVVMETKSERDRLQLELKKARRRALLSMDLPFAKLPAPPSDNGIVSLTLDSARRRWISGALSNFDYLTLLNTLAGRSYNDPAQYLVFPWVVANYESPELDLESPSFFRDLSKPMGALTEERIAYVKERYATLDSSAESTGIPPFHFGTHYSCSGYVANFLFRLEPFSRMALQLQGGTFDRADRLFRSVDATWKSASGLNLNMQDVRELVPEFYCMHEFLENRNRFELGVTQRGALVGDVELPAWAKGSAREFIRLHRKALESKYVSEHLNEWIDLIFGYKQRGREAIKAINVFHPLTYEGEVDLDAITDPSEREATMEQIHSFGQTPTRLFDSQPHPKKEIPPADNWAWHSPLAPPLVVPGTLDRPLIAAFPVPAFKFDSSPNNAVNEFKPGDVALVCVDDLPMVQGINTEVTFVNGPTLANPLRIVDVVLDESDKPCVLKAPQGYGAAFVGSGPSRYVLFGDSDGSLEIHATSFMGPLSSELVDKVLVSFEHLHRGAITHLCIVDHGKLFVTGGNDGVVCIWRVRRSNEFWRLEQEAANVGHRAGSIITSLTVCKEQGLIVSGGDDCVVNIWDLGRRQELIRTLRGHKKPVAFVNVNPYNGNIMSVCEKESRVWHINGDLIAVAEFKKYDLTTPTSMLATPCYDYQPGVVLVVGHMNGDVSLWDLLYPGDKTATPRAGDEGKTTLELRALLRHGTSPVVAVKLSRDKRMLVTADLKGEVRRWSSVETINRRYKHLIGPSSGIAALPGQLLGGAMSSRGNNLTGKSTSSFSSAGGSEKSLAEGGKPPTAE